jgi:LPXTG-motif cell wall-anchored protein
MVDHFRITSASQMAATAPVNFTWVVNGSVVSDTNFYTHIGASVNIEIQATDSIGNTAAASTTLPANQNAIIPTVAGKSAIVGKDFNFTLGGIIPSGATITWTGATGTGNTASARITAPTTITAVMNDTTFSIEIRPPLDLQIKANGAKLTDGKFYRVQTGKFITFIISTPSEPEDSDVIVGQLGRFNGLGEVRFFAMTPKTLTMPSLYASFRATFVSQSTQIHDLGSETSSSNSMTWGLLLIVLLAGIVGFVVYKKRNSDETKAITENKVQS